MLDFLYTSKPNQETQISERLREIYPNQIGVVHSLSGNWGTVAFYAACWGPVDFDVEEDFIAVLIGCPHLSWLSRTDRTSGGDSSRCTELISRWKIGDLKWDQDLDGPFAALLIDCRTQSVTCVTDLMSFIPVYDVRTSWGHVIGSHVDAVATISGSCNLDYVSLAEFLVSGIVTYPHSCYQGVKQLPPATITTYNIDHDRYFQTYWAPIEQNKPDAGFGEYSTRLQWELKTALSRKSSPNDRITVLVSAGEDSRAVLGAMPPSRKCRGVVYADGVTRETQIAEIICTIYGADFKLARRSPTQYLDHIDSACRLIGSGSQFFQAHSLGLSQKYELPRESIVLGGFGADRLVKGAHRPRKKQTRALFSFSLFGGNGSSLTIDTGDILYGIDTIAWKSIRQDIRDAIIRRRLRHRQSLAELRCAESVEEWARMWPSNMAIGSSHYTSNRRLMPIYEPFFCTGIVKISSHIPLRWKTNRRIFLAAMKPYLSKSKLTANSKGQYPYFGEFFNHSVLPRLKRIKRRFAYRTPNQRKTIVWADWEQLVTTKKWRDELQNRWPHSSIESAIFGEDSRSVTAESLQIKTKLNAIQIGTMFNRLVESNND